MDALNLGSAWTVAALVSWWSDSGFAERLDSRRHVERRLARHVVEHLGELPCADLTAEIVERLLSGLALGSEALNKVRSDLRRCIRAAKGSRRWPWDDPTEYVKPRRVPFRVRRTLSEDECRAMLWGAVPQHLALFACALYTGLRKGELVALRIDDVDLAARRLYVRRSRSRDTTKNGRARIVPIGDELACYLAPQVQLAALAGSLFVFPGRLGMRTVDAKLGRAVRIALARGGAIVSAFRFQDLRHTAATLLRRAGVDRDLVGAILGHAGKSATLIYTHFDESDLLNAANKLALGAPRRMQCVR